MCSQNRNSKKNEPTEWTPLFDFDETKQTIAENQQSAKQQPALQTVPQQPLSITELTFRLKELIELNFVNIEVVGQISNLMQPRSGHIYLTLKDEESQLPAVIWKSTVSKFHFKIKDGMEVICRGRLDVYPPQGKYQMIVSGLEPKGIGSLELAFRQLHDKLAALGYFEPYRKKPLPRVIQNVALITSPSGAAIRDFLQVLGRRTKRVNVLIIPVRVQGDGAALEIAEAIQTVHRIALRQPIDCIVVTRGGGSREDLWAFNEEILVRSIVASKIPIVSGVGHEIDVTLCDLAADVRALTPSEAAERIAPEDDELVKNLLQIQRQLDDMLEKQFRFCRDRLAFLEKQSALVLPERIIENRRRAVDLFEERLERSVDSWMQTAVQKFRNTAARLEALSPLAVLARGYSLTETEIGHQIQNINEVKIGNHIQTRLSNGVLKSVVTDIVAETK
ncbi:MAG: exodeoxyribonuclease VII large subunit [Planctomycetaceae bacterium]|jgi:exodeoxyribonuclease VII large subunit|nr:exodeoxyribonuclease VII large subunit [Planctomycetaceae bacterium]